MGRGRQVIGRGRRELLGQGCKAAKAHEHNLRSLQFVAAFILLHIRLYFQPAIHDPSTLVAIAQMPLRSSLKGAQVHGAHLRRFRSRMEIVMR